MNKKDVLLHWEEEVERGGERAAIAAALLMLVKEFPPTLRCTEWGALLLKLVEDLDQLKLKNEE